MGCEHFTAPSSGHNHANTGLRNPGRWAVTQTWDGGGQALGHYHTLQRRPAKRGHSGGRRLAWSFCLFLPAVTYSDRMLKTIAGDQV